MRLSTLALTVLLVLVLSSAHDSRADRLTDRWPVCDTPAAVRSAKTAQTFKRMQEIERLGCIVETPPRLRVRVVRCEPRGMWWPERFDYSIVGDDTLPESVCEIEAWLPNGWKATLFTHFMNVWPDR